MNPASWIAIAVAVFFPMFLFPVLFGRVRKKDDNAQD